MKVFSGQWRDSVTIRLLDPPLHEFLPNLEDLLVEVTFYEKEKIIRSCCGKRNCWRQVRFLDELNSCWGTAAAGLVL